MKKSFILAEIYQQNKHYELFESFFFWIIMAYLKQNFLLT